MNTTLLKATIAFVAVTILFIWSWRLFFKEKGKWRLLQLFGGMFLFVVVIVHIFEALQVFTFMHWGSPHSIGHYIDFTSAILGIVLFPLGFILNRFIKNQKKNSD